MMGGQQIIILKEGTEREKGKGAVFNNIAAARAMADAEAVKLLRELAFSVKRTDKDTLRSIARTAMSGRSVGTNANFLADIAVDAVQAIVEEVAGEVRADVDNILVQKKHGGNLTDTTLIDGIVLDKERVHPRMAKF